MSNKLIVVLGSGPGIGSQTAAYFTAQGFNSVALLSRNAQRLSEDAAAVKEAASSVRVETYPVDLADATALQSTLEKVESELGKPEVVLFNAARVAPSMIGQESPDNLLQDFKTMSVGIYVAGGWAMKALAGSHPSFFLSGGQLWNKPIPGFSSLSMNKAAQVCFMEMFGEIVGPKGIHVATIDIGGIVQDSDPTLNAKNIAKTFWELYQEDKSNWRNMVTLGDMDDLRKVLKENNQYYY